MLITRRNVRAKLNLRSQASPEVVRAAKPASQQKVDLAERELASGNPAGAQKLAEEALKTRKTRRELISSWPEWLP